MIRFVWILLFAPLLPANALVGERVPDAIECALASDQPASPRSPLSPSGRQSSVTKYRYSASKERRYICVMDVICQSRLESSDRSEPTRQAVACAERDDGGCPSIRDCIEASGLESTPGMDAPDGKFPRFGGSSTSGDPHRARRPDSIRKH